MDCGEPRRRGSRCKRNAPTDGVHLTPFQQCLLVMPAPARALPLRNPSHVSTLRFGLIPAG